MTKNYIIKSGPRYFIEGSDFHKVYTFSPEDAALFTEFGAALKVIEIDNKNEMEIIKIK